MVVKGRNLDFNELSPQNRGVLHRAWYQLNKDLFSTDKVSNDGLWINGALSFCIQSGSLCNFLCPFCLSDSGPMGVTKSEWIEYALRNLKNIAGVSRIVWAGGEPTLVPEIDKLVSFSKSLGNINILTTNGYKYFTNSDVDWLDFSIYGVDNSSYMNMTGRSVCDKVWKNLEQVTKVQSRVSANAILNLNSTNAIVKMILRCYDLGVLRVKLHRPLPIGRNNQQIPEIDTLHAIEEIRHSVPKEMVVSYPLTNTAHELTSGYWVIKAPGVITNDHFESSIGDEIRVAHAIKDSLRDHYRIFVNQ